MKKSLKSLKTHKKTHKRNTKKLTLKKSSKSKKQNKEYTKYYLIKGPHFNYKKIKEIFNKRGNLWKEYKYSIKNTNPDFLFIDLAYLHKYKNELDKYLNVKLKNIVDLSSDNQSISNKYNLNKNMRQYNNKEITKYLLNEKHIDLHEIYNNFNKLINNYKKLFDKGKVWILKPIYGYAGMGIKIINNFTLFKKILKKQIKKNKYLKKFNRRIYENKGVNGKLKYNIEWILQEYISNPLLLDNKKFHIRIYYIYDASNKKSYILDKGEIATAKKDYIPNNYDNNDIHDSHFYKTKRPYYFPNDLINLIGEDKYEYIFNEIISIFKGVHKCIKAKCYKESKKCFHIFGSDVMITNNYEVKLIELNHKPSFSIFNSSNISTNLFENIMDTIVDKQFNPSRKITKLNNFIDVTKF